MEQKRNELFKLEKEKTLNLTKIEDLEVEESKVDQRLQKLIESPESVAQITEYVENSEEAEKRAQELQNRWIRAKTEKDGEIRKARELYDAKIKSGSLASETVQVLSAAEELKMQLPQKEAQLQKLVRKAETLEQAPLNRNAYTKRIFEMVASIKKQQADIEKVLKDKAQVQKEISSLNGRLDRTFTAVEERLYKEAQRDTQMQKAYRLLVKIHEQCASIISVIETSGKAECEIDEINDSISTFQQRGLDEMLEKVLKDWALIQEENKNLAKMLVSD